MTDECIMGGNHEYPKDVYGGHCIKCGQSPIISGGSIMTDELKKAIDEAKDSKNNSMYDWEILLMLLKTPLTLP